MAEPRSIFLAGLSVGTEYLFVNVLLRKQEPLYVYFILYIKNIFIAKQFIIEYYMRNVARLENSGFLPVSPGNTHGWAAA